MDPSRFPLLAQAAGPLLPWLLDDEVTEIRCTSSGACFIVRFGKGKARVEDVEAADLDSFLAVVASMVGAEWRESSPRLQAGLSKLGLRIQASREPVSPGPQMVVRKHTRGVFPLEDFQAKHILTADECTVLREAVCARQTILIAGATHTAKTSIANSLLHELRDSEERIVICEESPELLFAGPDVTFLRTIDADGERPGIDLRALCRDVLRLSPDRVIVGEVRGGECLEMLKIFDTGHPGISTIHAESALGALQRMEQLIGEVSLDAQQRLIASAIDIIVHMQRSAHTWGATEIRRVEGWTAGNYHTTVLTQRRPI